MRTVITKRIRRRMKIEERIKKYGSKCVKDIPENKNKIKNLKENKHE